MLFSHFGAKISLPYTECSFSLNYGIVRLVCKLNLEIYTALRLAEPVKQDDYLNFLSERVKIQHVSFSKIDVYYSIDCGRTHIKTIDNQKDGKGITLLRCGTAKM